MKFSFALLLLFTCGTSILNATPLLKLAWNTDSNPFDQYSYLLARHIVKSSEHDYHSQARNLNEKEKLVSIYFEKLKQSEFDKTRKRFSPSKPIEKELEVIQQRKLYDLLKKLPKGGNLHLHEDQVLNRRVLLEYIRDSSEEYEMLHICDKLNKPTCREMECKCAEYHMEYIPSSQLATDGWVKVKDSNWTIDAIINKTTLNGLLNGLKEKIRPTDSASRWSMAGQVFTCYSSVISYNKTRFAYLKIFLDLSLKENVQLIEMRRFNFGDLYYFNEQGEKIFISTHDELNMLRQFKSDYSKVNPKFIDFVFIIQSIRAFSNEKIKQELDTAIEAHKQFPDMIKGFDLVSEEDIGNTLLYYSQVLLTGLNYSLSTNNSFGFYFPYQIYDWDYPPEENNHASVAENIYDAIVFKSRRIGHGIGLIKHPKLYSHFIQNKIAIELCPASNQILGFIPDVRNHPGLNYLKSGVPIVIGGDDPGSFGYNELTVDYYLVFMSWGLSLFDLREIANNSIRYSSTSDSMKLIGFDKFESEWNFFIDQTHEAICTTLIENNYSEISLKRVYPFYNLGEDIKFKIYGRGFENLLCKKIECLFNESIKTKGYLNNWRQFVCDRPSEDLSNQRVSLSLLVNGTRIENELTFNYF